MNAHAFLWSAQTGGQERLEEFQNERRPTDISASPLERRMRTEFWGLAPDDFRWAFAPQKPQWGSAGCLQPVGGAPESALRRSFDA